MLVTQIDLISAIEKGPTSILQFLQLSTTLVVAHEMLLLCLRDEVYEIALKWLQ